jgi:sporulation protein YlmC with PRC-barrel domain
MARLPIRSISGAVAILGLCSLATAQQAPNPPAETPPAPRTEPSPGGTPAPTKPPAVKPSEAPAAAPAQSMVGLDVFTSDGTRVGEVRGMSTGPGGEVVTLHVRTGGFLGFGGRIVAVPQGRFTRTGQIVRLDLDSDQVSGLPEVKE